MDQSYINSIMYKHIAYNFILIFIIIKCVKSQDNNPDQPFDDDEEGDEDNFEVLDLEQIIQQRISRFDDPQYQPDYQQLEEPQYPTQPLTQPQYYDLYQTQPEPQYQPHGPPQTITQQPNYQYYEDTLTQPTHQQYYITTTTPQPTQPPIYQYYEPETQDPYGYQPYQAHSQQPSYQYYGPPSQLTQQQQQYYDPSQPQTVTQAPQLQTQPQTMEEYDNFYVTQHDQPYQGPSATDPEFLYGPTQPTTRPITQPTIQQPITQESTHYVPPPQDQVAQKPTESIKRKRTQTPSGDQGEEEDEEESAKRKKQLLKLYDIKLLKNDSDGKLVEMTEEDYLIIFSDRAKTKLKFKTDLEQIECEGDIIYVHQSGAPYCSGLAISRYTKIFILVGIDEFILIKKTRGSWETTQKTVPNYVKLYTQDDEGNDVLLTNDDYDIDFTSRSSFRYELVPGIECHKIEVGDLVAWEKTEEDDGHPEVIYVSPKLTVIVNFHRYSKVFLRRISRYQLQYTKPISKNSKYT